MALEIEMPPIKVGKEQLPGGWLLWVPEVSVNEQDLEKKKGFRGGTAEDIERICQSAVTYYWKMITTQVIVRRAKQYKKINPDLGLKGFDPEMLQAAYVPGAKSSHGRRGDPQVKQALVLMGRKEREGV